MLSDIFQPSRVVALFPRLLCHDAWHGRFLFSLIIANWSEACCVVYTQLTTKPQGQEWD